MALLMWRSIRRSSIALLMDVRFSSSSFLSAPSPPPPFRCNVDLHNLFSLPPLSLSNVMQFEENYPPRNSRAAKVDVQFFQEDIYNWENLE